MIRCRDCQAVTDAGKPTSCPDCPSRIFDMAITLFECDVCEWAATTGNPWTRCPHCDTQVPPRRRQAVYLNDAQHAARMA